MSFRWQQIEEGMWQSEDGRHRIMLDVHWTLLEKHNHKWRRRVPVINGSSLVAVIDELLRQSAAGPGIINLDARGCRR
jgi:hypothetical protein